MLVPISATLLALLLSILDMQSGNDERFRRHMTEIDGSITPEGIPTEVMLQRLLNVADTDSFPFAMSLSDAQVLGRFDYQFCTEKEHQGTRLEALRDTMLEATPAEAGAAMNQLIWELSREVREKWQAALGQVSAPARVAITDYIDREVLPETRHHEIDMAGLWQDFPALFERWLNPPSIDSTELPLMPGPSIATAQDGSQGATIQTYAIVSGTPQWERHCVSLYVRWVEPSIVDLLIGEYSLDTPQENMEDFLRKRSPRLLNFDQLDAQRARMFAISDALDAVAEGADIDPTFDDFQLEYHGFSRQSWLRLSSTQSPGVGDVYRRFAEEMTLERQTEKVLLSRWLLYAFIENQWVDQLFGPGPIDPCEGLRSSHVKKNLAAARERYEAFAGRLLVEPPTGWESRLIMFRPTTISATP